MACSRQTGSFFLSNMTFKHKWYTCTCRIKKNCIHDFFFDICKISITLLCFFASAEVLDISISYVCIHVIQMCVESSASSWSVVLTWSEIQLKTTRNKRWPCQQKLLKLLTRNYLQIVYDLFFLFQLSQSCFGLSPHEDYFL